MPNLNNAIIIHSSELATCYLDYWKQLKREGDAQSQSFRASNDKVRSFRTDENVDLWFSPNTQQQTKPKNPATPSDLGEVFALLDKAKEGILFLEFQPGIPDVMDHLAIVQNNNPKLFGTRCCHRS